MLVRQSQAPWEQRADHIFETDRPAVTHRSVVPRVLDKLGAGPAGDVGIHRAEAVRRSLAPCIELVVKSRVFHFTFDHAHVEIKVMAADTPAATLHFSKVGEQFAERAEDW